MYSSLHVIFFIFLKLFLLSFQDLDVWRHGEGAGVQRSCTTSSQNLFRLALRKRPAVTAGHDCNRLFCLRRLMSLRNYIKQMKQCAILRNFLCDCGYITDCPPISSVWCCITATQKQPIDVWIYTGVVIRQNCCDITWFLCEITNIFTLTQWQWHATTVVLEIH